VLTQTDAFHVVNGSNAGNGLYVGYNAGASGTINLGGFATMLVYGVGHIGYAGSGVATLTNFGNLQISGGGGASPGPGTNGLTLGFTPSGYGSLTINDHASVSLYSAN